VVIVGYYTSARQTTEKVSLTAVLKGARSNLSEILIMYNEPTPLSDKEKGIRE